MVLNAYLLDKRASKKEQKYSIGFHVKYEWKQVKKSQKISYNKKKIWLREII